MTPEIATPNIIELKELILSVVTVAGSVGASLVGTYAWVRAKFAANDVEITNIKLRLQQRDEIAIRESSTISRELMEMRQENSKENKEIKNLVSNIQVNCATHNQMWKNMDTVVQLAIKNEIDHRPS